MKPKKAIVPVLIIITALCLAIPSCATPPPMPDTNLDGDTSASPFGNYLLMLEASVKYSYQTSGWRSRRSGWIQEVRNAGNNVSELKRLLREFEREILSNGQSGNWGRGDWVRRVGEAASISQLAALLLRVEQSILFRAQASSWRRRRPSWMAMVNRLRDDQMASAETRPEYLGRYLIQVEASMKSEHLKHSWQSERTGWIARVKDAGGDGTKLRSLILEFGGAILPQGMTRSWESADWNNMMRGAASIGDLARHLLNIERNILYAAQHRSWRYDRPGWLRRVSALRSLKEPIAPMEPDSSQGAAEGKVSSKRDTKSGFQDTVVLKNGKVYSNVKVLITKTAIGIVTADGKSMVFERKEVKSVKLE